MIDHALSPGFLGALQRETFDHFVHEANPLNGLIADKTQAGWPASIAAVGFALSADPVGVERGFMLRADAITRTLATLRFFHASDQSTDVDATGYKGFYYHFLDMVTGRRVWTCELSTIDSAILIAGMLTAAAYFSGENEDEREIRALADALYLRAHWNWAQNGGVTVTHGWKPESGFLRYRWQGYCEAMIFYLLGLGSPTHPLPRESWARWTSTYDRRTLYNHELLYAGPLFIHQFSHIWIDFRGIQDAYIRDRRIDYFENGRRATCVHQQYAIANPARYDAYGENSWGLTASDGPGPATSMINGKKRRFFAYKARGAPDGPDDGSVAPWAVAASLPFAREIVQPTLAHFETLKLRESNAYGFKATFNATMADKSGPSRLWVSPFHFGINQGPIVVMLENYRTGLIWTLSRRCTLSPRRASPRGLYRGMARQFGGRRKRAQRSLIRKLAMAIPGLKACADRFDDTLRFVRVAHSDGLRACLLRGIVISAREERVAHKDHVGDGDA